MKIQRFACLLALAFLLAAGCSENPGDPSREFSLSGLAAENIGPSEIVLSIDVSDSISFEELAAVVSDLSSCLADPDLIPQNGMVSVAAFVYADSVASILPSPVPVTGASLSQTILPAISGLLQNRQVPTNGFDLAGALQEAGTLLGNSQVSDRHVLILGSGAVDDAGAVLSGCEALGGAGIMVSTLAIGADAAGLALFADCAAATGGFSGEFVPEESSSCAEALAYMLVVELDLEPETAERPRGETHAVTADVFRGGDPEAYPVVGQEVIFSVIAGPNTSEGATDSTDATGAAAFSYVGDGGPGTDVIVAQTLHPGTGSALTDTVTVTWANVPPVCDAGGPYTLVAESDTASVLLDAGGSTDADGDSLRFVWSVDCEGAWFNDPTAAAPELTVTGDCLCVEALTVHLTVSDGFESSECTSTVTIQDLRPPIVELVENPPQLWPPNHKFTEIRPDMLIAKATDACGNPIDLDTAVILEVGSSEPDDGKGDGNTSGDIDVACPNHLRLRAERAGGNHGRVYGIVYRITAESGAFTDVETGVLVPHDSSGKKYPGDGYGEPAYSVSTDCAGVSE